MQDITHTASEKCHFEPDSEALRGFDGRERQEELTDLPLEREPYLELLKDKGYDYICEPHGIRGENVLYTSTFSITCRTSSYKLDSSTNASIY